MTYKFLLLVLIFSTSLSAQKKVAKSEIYRNNQLAYSVEENQPFTGIVQSLKGNHIIYEEYYTNGYKTKYVRYHNSKEKQVVAYETFYHPNSFFKEKEFEYSDSKNKTRKRYFDANGEITYMEIIENDKLTYSCEYLNGKRNGKEFCITKNSDRTDTYVNGKKVSQ